MYITKIASKLANTTLPPIKTTVVGQVKSKVLRMVTSSQSPVLTLDTLPSGKYRRLKHRAYASFVSEMLQLKVLNYCAYPFLVNQVIFSYNSFFITFVLFDESSYFSVTVFLTVGLQLISFIIHK